MNLLEGKLLAEGQRIGIVAGRFNEFITSKLLGGALDAFKRHGGDEANIDLAWVPGAFEIPLVAWSWDCLMRWFTVNLSLVQVWAYVV